MSSALMWRAEPSARMSRIFRRGSVTLSPALRRSLLSLVEGGFRRCDMLWHSRYDTSPIINHLTATHHFDEYISSIVRELEFRSSRFGLRLSHQHSAGQFFGSSGG